MMRISLCSQCDCKKRQEWLNQAIPGFGDKLAVVFNPIQQMICERENSMPSILKPDLKSLVWLAIGAVLVPMVRSKFNV